MRRAWREKENEQPLAATAIVVPVYNENVARVSAGMICSGRVRRSK